MRRGPQHPSACLSPVECSFRHDKVLSGGIFLRHFPERNTIPAFGNPRPVTNRSEKIHPASYKLHSGLAGMFLPGKDDNQRNIHYLLIKRRFLVPVMCTDSVPMVTGENDKAVFPQGVVINGLDDLAYFSIHLFDEPVINITVVPPVLVGKTHGRICGIVGSLFIEKHVGIIGIAFKIPGQRRAVLQRRKRHIAIRKILGTGPFTNIVRVFE